MIFFVHFFLHWWGTNEAQFIMLIGMIGNVPWRYPVPDWSVCWVHLPAVWSVSSCLWEVGPAAPANQPLPGRGPTPDAQTQTHNFKTKSEWSYVTWPKWRTTYSPHKLLLLFVDLGPAFLSGLCQSLLQGVCFPLHLLPVSQQLSGQLLTLCLCLRARDKQHNRGFFSPLESQKCRRPDCETAECFSDPGLVQIGFFRHLHHLLDLQTGWPLLLLRLLLTSTGCTQSCH